MAQTQTPSDLEYLSERVAGLEAQNRRFKRLIGSVAILASVFLLMGQAQTRRVLEADEFVLKDKAGRPRARLAMEGLDHITPMLVFLDEHGSGVPVAISAGSEPSLTLTRPGTNELVVLGANPRFYGLVLYDADSHRAGLAVQKGVPGLDLFDHDGSPRVSLRSDPALDLFGKNGKVISSLP